MYRLLLLSRICEVFGCLPDAAAEALDEDPEQLVLQVMDVRAYAQVKDAYDSTSREDDPKMDQFRDSPLLPIVRANTRFLITGKH